jgi:MFS family permease
MRISSRFALDILFVIGAAFLTVAAMSLAAPVAGWVAFGVSAGFAVTGAASMTLAGRTGQRFGHAAVAAVGLWSLVAALAFSGAALTWLVLADAIALGVVAIADLTAHEVSEESVVHRLEVATAPESGQLAG